jgi:hypothetical protein
MSSLGIKFVLPYVGENGLKVTDNKIGLDQNGLGSIGALVIAANAEDPLAICNSQYGSLVVYSSQNYSQVNAVFRDSFSTDPLAVIDKDGNIDNTNSGNINTNELIANLTLTDNISINPNGSLGYGQTNIQKLGATSGLNFTGDADGQGIGIKNKVNGAVVVDLTRSIPIIVNGVTYKLIIAV